MAGVRVVAHVRLPGRRRRAVGREAGWGRPEARRGRRRRAPTPDRSRHLLLHLAQAEAAAVDLQDVAVVQQPVEDRGGEDLVAGEHLGPGTHALEGS